MGPVGPLAWRGQVFAAAGAVGGEARGGEAGASRGEGARHGARRREDAVRWHGTGSVAAARGAGRLLGLADGQ